jgi:hypothetical protein
MADVDALPAQRDTLPLLIGVITLIGGVATGLFSDLDRPGKSLGVVVFALWAFIIARVLWNPELTRRVRGWTMVAVVLTVALVLVAAWNGPRLSDRTVLLSREGARNLNTACKDTANGRDTAEVDIALNQLQDQFVHVEPKHGDCTGKDVRLPASDLLTVTP